MQLKSKLKSIILALLLMITLKTRGQDYIYSQFFNAPVYLNPALNGEFKGTFRANLIYRNQWSAMSGDLNYMTASADYQFPSMPGAVGIMFNSSTEGTAYLKKNNIAGIYSYSVGSEDFTASFGIQAGLTNRKLDFSKLVFSDQLDPRLGYEGSPSAAEAPYNNNKYFFDAGAGVNIVFKNAMLGASFMHLNKPDESFTGSRVYTPVRTAVHASYRYALDRNAIDDEDGSFLIPSVVYYKQAEATSMAAGMQFKYRGVNAGAWFRTNGKNQSDAFVFSLIFDIFTNSYRNQKLRVGVSHDATTNKLNYSNTSGTSELSVGFETGAPRERGYGGLKCYDFY